MDFSWLVKMLIPPEPWDGSHTFFFNLFQSVSTYCIWGIVWIGVLWLGGHIQFLPQPAFATDVQKIETKINKIDRHSQTMDTTLKAILLLSVQNNIPAAEKEVCLSLRSGDQVRLDNANTSLADLVGRYYSMGGTTLPPMDCHIILVDQPQKPQKQ